MYMYNYNTAFRNIPGGCSNDQEFDNSFAMTWTAKNPCPKLQFFISFTF